MRGAIPLVPPPHLAFLAWCLAEHRSSCGHHRGRFEAETFPVSQEFILSRKRPEGLHETDEE